jgi:hypothetical protein
MYAQEAVKVIKTSQFHLKMAETEKNGICLIAKWNMSFFETENHWPYTVSECVSECLTHKNALLNNS